MAQFLLCFRDCRQHFGFLLAMLKTGKDLGSFFESRQRFFVPVQPNQNFAKHFQRPYQAVSMFILAVEADGFLVGLETFFYFALL